MKGASEDPGCALKVISKENLSESTPKLFLQLVHWALTGKSEGGSRFSQAVSTSALGRLRPNDQRDRTSAFLY